MMQEEKIYIKIQEFLKEMEDSGFAWNDIVNVLSETLMLICKSNIEDIEGIDQIILEKIKDDMSTKIFIKSK